MKNYIYSIKDKIFKIEKEKVICFNVSNFEDAIKKDAECITKAEKQLANIGAIPVKIDWPSKLFCVSLANPNVKVKEIESVLKRYGFKAKIKNKENGVFKYTKAIKIFPK